MKIIVTDEVSPEGLALLTQEPRIQLDLKLGLKKDELMRLNKSIEWDNLNPPKSQFENSCIHPAERRIKLTIDAINDSDGKHNATELFAEHLESSANSMGVLLNKTATAWDALQKVRKLVLSSVKSWETEGRNVDESKAWEILAPEAMKLAERFVEIADHPYTRTVAYGKEATMFCHVLRKEAWVKEEIGKFKNFFGSQQLTIDSFQSSTSSDKVSGWETVVTAMAGKESVFDSLKANSKTWKDPIGVSCALIKNGKTEDLKLWIEAVGEQKLAAGTNFNLNTLNQDLGGYTLMDYALENCPKSEMKNTIEVLRNAGARMNASHRLEKNDYNLLISNMEVDSVKDAVSWIKWLRKNSTEVSGFNKDGNKEAVSALKDGKLEWAIALLGLRKNVNEPMSIDGKDWIAVWKDYKAENPDKIEGWKRLKKDTFEAMEKITSNKPGETINKTPDFWADIDRLEKVGAVATPKQQSLRF